MFSRLIFLIFFVLAGAALYWIFKSPPIHEGHLSIFTSDIVGKRHYLIKEKNRAISFDLIDPENAPPEIHKQVMNGYRIFIETPKYAPHYTGDKLTCNSCHIGGGNTLGGENGGISLVGVTAVYPKYVEESKKKISLKERINNCFIRSMNGKTLPENSQEMNDIIAYLTWISQEVIRVGNFPWLGLPKIKSTHQPDPAAGAVVYQNHCSICHLPNGEGAPGIPPVWGDHSYNDGAGMNDVGTLASFVWKNMPYQQPILSPKQALDVAAYISSRPRPHFR